MKKRIMALLLVTVMVLSFSAVAYADPSYSPDGVTCTGEGCHGNAGKQESTPPPPAPAPTVEEEPAEEAAPEVIDHTGAAEKMAEIVMEEIFPDGIEETEEEAGTLVQILVTLFKSFLDLITYLVK